jgi:hypothetical protein
MNKTFYVLLILQDAAPPVDIHATEQHPAYQAFGQSQQAVLFVFGGFGVEPMRGSFLV